jgi:hypothetical protein
MRCVKHCRKQKEKSQKSILIKNKPGNKIKMILISGFW